ncbi:MAG TPA: hypothetical protein VFY16_11645, partial [Gemmatimonadaceae bacterium]|nr:hypothetical protein [Gemmatimonadaceae bacterium]
MHVHDIRVERRPVDGRVRLLAEVEYGSGEAGAETYWIDVPGAVADDVSTTASPWAALLVPLALRGDGTLRLDAPVDRELAVGLQEWADVWRSWDRALAPLRLEADLCDAGAPRGSRTAAFFSGGVDSWYTVLAARRDDARHDASRAARRPPLRDLLCVWGFDILLDNEPAFARLRA